MKFIKAYIKEHDLTAQNCISDDLATRLSKSEFHLHFEISDTPFDIEKYPIISRYRSKWQFDKGGKILGLTTYREEE
jgi:hypothetical protein